jgi:hypothetical protein
MCRRETGGTPALQQDIRDLRSEVWFQSPLAWLWLGTRMAEAALAVARRRER